MTGSRFYPKLKLPSPITAFALPSTLITIKLFHALRSHSTSFSRCSRGTIGLHTDAIDGLTPLTDANVAASPAHFELSPGRLLLHSPIPVCIIHTLTFQFTVSIASQLTPCAPLTLFTARAFPHNIKKNFAPALCARFASTDAHKVGKIHQVIGMVFACAFSELMITWLQVPSST